MRISDWSSDVCSSDLHHRRIFIGMERDDSRGKRLGLVGAGLEQGGAFGRGFDPALPAIDRLRIAQDVAAGSEAFFHHQSPDTAGPGLIREHGRSDVHTSELQSLMRTSYAVFDLIKKSFEREITRR